MSSLTSNPVTSPDKPSSLGETRGGFFHACPKVFCNGLNRLKPLCNAKLKLSFALQSGQAVRDSLTIQHVKTVGSNVDQSILE